ncbi:hypothetical protein HanIR_Chr16g0807181 [Helianthus annuus]|nr:hypothetical protein HanIR_Chr16g0807181 [Helianthus annuus]
MNANGFFFFKFADQMGMTNVLKEGPWIIKSRPLILNEWSPNSKLEKKEVKKLQVWVKIHDVPIAAYTEDGLSLIARTIGNPIALDSYTTSMCVDIWGRSSYARALIEISAENDFKEELTMVVPDIQGEGFHKETMYVEYEWAPHRCGHCCVFGHSDETCPRQIRVSSKNSKLMDEDGYTEVQKRKPSKKPGYQMNKKKLEYRPKAEPVGVGTSNVNKKESNSQSNFVTKNPFDVLQNDHVLEPIVSGTKESTSGIKKYHEGSDDDEVEEIYNETSEFRAANMTSGASTPAMEGING